MNRDFSGQATELIQRSFCGGVSLLLPPGEVGTDEQPRMFYCGLACTGATVKDMDEHQDEPQPPGGQSGDAMGASTWREAGRFLTPSELSAMTVDEQADYQIRSAPRTLDEIDAMPEPQRSVFLRLEARAAARQQRRAS
jgi:hypothetical protein